jgi:predicted small metal-binding protein
MRVIECNVCGETLSAASDEELVGRLRRHLADEHDQDDVDEEQLAETVEEEAYEAMDS